MEQSDRIRELEAENRRLRGELEVAWSVARFPEENPHPVLRASGDGTVLYANQPARQLLAELGHLPGDSLPKTLADGVRHVLRQDASHEVEFVCARRRVFAFILAPSEVSGNVNLYGRDVTDHRLAEQALRESEERYRALFNGMTEGFALHEMIFDGEGKPCDYRFLEVNPAFERLTGLKRASLLGRTLHQILPDNDVFWLDTYARVVETGEPVHFEQYSTPLGRHFEVFAFRPAEQQFACLFLDVTDRRIGEEKLRALTETLEERVVERTAIAEQRAAQLRALAAQLTQAEERERQRVARVLHDQLQQLLVSARMKISVLCRRFQDPKLVETLGEVDQLIQQSIEESRSLTRELSPPVLYDGGLTAGLDWLARHMNRKHGLLVEVDASTETEPEESTRAFLFQAVRELLLNTVKHAGIDAASVELSFQENGRLRVVVSDDGVGFDAATLDICGDASRFGLFSLRERVELMGGSLRLETGPGQGTRVIVEVPALLDQGDVRASSEGQASRR